MEPLDVARQKFEAFLEKVKEPAYWRSIKSEADVRMKVIDPIFVDILGWPESEVHLESSTSELFIDYRCTIKNLNRLIVEAKKEARDLGINESHAARFFQLKGSVFNTEASREGIKQAINYCGHKSAELACLTNGRQWAIFRGARGNDGIETIEGMACVFGSLDAVLARFQEFYDLLAYEKVEEYTYRAAFRQAEGQPVRQKSSKSIARNPDSRMMIKADKLSADLDRIMLSFFRELSSEKDAEARRECFVTTSESEAAERGLERISEALRDQVRSLNTAESTELTEIIKRVHEMQKNELVLLVGTKGAGKSTFIDRFFDDVLPAPVRSDCVIIRLDLSSSGRNADTITQWLDEHFLEAAEKAAFPDGPPSYEEIQGMCFGEYRRWSEGHAKHLYETNKTQFKIDFGKHIETYFRQQRPHQYIIHLLLHIVRSHKKVPCIVFDNADHFDVPFQEAVFNYAHSLCSEVVCLMILPITDTTSWQLAKQGPMQSFYSDSFFLPTPPTELVLRRRIEYIEKCVAEEQAQSRKKPETGTGYFLPRGMKLEIGNIKGFAACLQTVFVNTGQVADWIGRLANQDIRRALQFTREIVASPHIHVAELLAAHVEKATMPVNANDVKNAMIRGKYDIYYSTVQSFIQNLFNLNPEFETTPLLPPRVLQFLDAAWQSNHDNDGRYILVTEVVDYMQAMNIDARATNACLDVMLKRGLCLSYDPTTDGIKGTVKVEISPSGRQHLTWALRDWAYLEAMAESTPMYDSGAVESIRDCLKNGRADLRRNAIAVFINYLLQEDAHYCIVPKHEIYAAQAVLADVLKQQVGALSAFAAISVTDSYRRPTGRVMAWKKDKGYGFIKPTVGDKDVFLNITEVLGPRMDTIPENSMVEFDVMESDKGPRAVNVVILT